MNAKREFEKYLAKKDIIKIENELKKIEQEITLLESILEKKINKVIHPNTKINGEIINLKEKIKMLYGRRFQLNEWMSGVIDEFNNFVVEDAQMDKELANLQPRQ